MGFLSGLSKTLFGGSDSSSQQQSTSGFSLLPSEIQAPYKTYGTQVNSALNADNLTRMYTPLPQTAGETKAYGAINGGFTPNAGQLTSDINMQTDPYRDSVINTINRNAYGDNSVLKSALTAAGQYGSNRGALGANDIAGVQADKIGSFMSGEFNTALENALTTLPALRANDASMQLGAGGEQRQLAGQTAQAPISALQQIGIALGILPSNGGSQSTGSSQSSSNNGIFKSIGL